MQELEAASDNSHKPHANPKNAPKRPEAIPFTPLILSQQHPKLGSNRPPQYPQSQPGVHTVVNALTR